MLRSFCAITLIMFSLAAAAGNPGEHFRSPVPVSYCVYHIGGGVDETGKEIYVSAADINNRGYVTGTTSAPGTRQAYVWHPGRGMHVLGVLPGEVHSEGSAINDAGVVVGNTYNSDLSSEVSFVWDARRGMRILDASLGFGAYFVSGINRFGQVTGTSHVTAGVVHAFRRDRNGDVLDLGTLGSSEFGESSRGEAVNDFGAVVGRSSAPGPHPSTGFIWSESTGMQRLPDPDDLTAVWPRAINNRGEVVGETTDPGRGAFLWTAAGGRINLGSLSIPGVYNTGAVDINAWSTVVGTSLTDDYVNHAFIWRRQHGMRDLNLMLDETSQLAPSVVLHHATAINDLGWITAEGDDLRQAGGSHAFLLVPRWHAGHPGCDRR